MTRILALADTQIGVGTVELADQRDVLDKIVALALERQIDVVVHGGDVFEGPVVTPEQLRLFIDATEPLRDEGIPIVIVRGNGRHDAAVRPVHALDVFREIEGFYVSDRPQQFIFGNVAVCTLPWVHPGTLMARLSGSVDHDRVSQVMADALVTIAADLCARTEVPAVLVAHWAISGAKLPSGLPVEQMREPVIPWAELDALGYHAVVGAHIHEPQVLSRAGVDRTPGFVVGSPQQLNFGEHGEHGVWILSLDGPEIFEFVPIPSRQFVTVELGEADQEIPDGALVRVRASMSEQAAREFDYSAFRGAVLDAGAHSVRFDISIEQAERRRVEISEQLSPVDAMRLYCDAHAIEESLREALLQRIDQWRHE